ncbi:hypothetical protein VTN77DRAFT_3943 [Rasamsonia byssochlamydoides]|uniref:uncharacterized protein n=1 Tax=Rasamsonia byssochlamydoides TaxID=89139 RepID=UPI0037432A9F
MARQKDSFLLFFMARSTSSSRVPLSSDRIYEGASVLPLPSLFAAEEPGDGKRPGEAVCQVFSSSSTLDDSKI